MASKSQPCSHSLLECEYSSDMAARSSFCDSLMASCGGRTTARLSSSSDEEGWSWERLKSWLCVKSSRLRMPCDCSRELISDQLTLGNSWCWKMAKMALFVGRVCTTCTASARITQLTAEYTSCGMSSSVASCDATQISLR